MSAHDSSLGAMSPTKKNFRLYGWCYMEEPIDATKLLSFAEYLFGVFVPTSPFDEDVEFCVLACACISFTDNVRRCTGAVPTCAVFFMSLPLSAETVLLLID